MSWHGFVWYHVMSWDVLWYGMLYGILVYAVWGMLLLLLLECTVTSCVLYQLCLATCDIIMVWCDMFVVWYGMICCAMPLFYFCFFTSSPCWCSLFHVISFCFISFHLISFRNSCDRCLMLSFCCCVSIWRFSDVHVMLFLLPSDFNAYPASPVMTCDVDVDVMLLDRQRAGNKEKHRNRNTNRNMTEQERRWWWL